jgi:uncharacterized protein (TIGR00251 family)
MEAPIARLHVRVSAGSGRDAVVGRHGTAWKVRVAAPPEHGRANAALVGVLADALGLARPEVRLVAGRGSRDKLVEVDGLTVEEAERRLAGAGGKEAR